MSVQCTCVQTVHYTDPIQESIFVKKIWILPTDPVPLKRELAEKRTKEEEEEQRMKKHKLKI